MTATLQATVVWLKRDIAEANKALAVERRDRAAELKAVHASYEARLAVMGRKVAELELEDQRRADHRVLALLNAELERTSALHKQVAELKLEIEWVREELTATRNNRLISAVFGHHKGAPRPFALHRSPDREAVALGAEFPDGATALRLADDGGWYTNSDGGAEYWRAGGVRLPEGGRGELAVVWLSDELESLAEAEVENERLRAELTETRRSLTEATHEILQRLRARDGVIILKDGGDLR